MRRAEKRRERSKVIVETYGMSILFFSSLSLILSPVSLFLLLPLSISIECLWLWLSGCLTFGWHAYEPGFIKKRNSKIGVRLFLSLSFPPPSLYYIALLTPASSVINPCHYLDVFFAAKKTSLSCL